MKDWKEVNLFDWLKENVYPDLVKAKRQMSRWDCYSPSTGHRLELKCRRAHYDTLLIEKKKYDSMKKECEKHLDTPMYFNSTPKGIYSFNLNLIDPKWEVNSKNPATTYWSKKEKIEKEVAYLEISKSKKWKTL
jgi:hypothetical protein